MDFLKHYDHLELSVASDDDSFPTPYTSAGLCTVDLLRFMASDSNNGIVKLSDSLKCNANKSEEILRGLRKFCFDNLCQSEKQSKTISDEPTISLMFPEDEIAEEIQLGSILEVSGVSGSGKSQYVYQTCAGVQRENNDAQVVLVNTEGNLETRKLSSILGRFGFGLMNCISQIYCSDLETFDHVIFTQLPLELHRLAAKGSSPKLIVIDSISHHLRGDDGFLESQSYLKAKIAQQNSQLRSIKGCQTLNMAFRSYEAFFKRTCNYLKLSSRIYYIMSLHKQLIRLAHLFNLAVIVTNQVSLLLVDLDRDQPHGSINYVQQLVKLPKWGLNDLPVIQSIDQPYHHMPIESVVKEVSGVNESLQLVPCLGHSWSRLSQSRLLLRRCFVTKSDFKEGCNDDSPDRKTHETGPLKLIAVSLIKAFGGENYVSHAIDLYNIRLGGFYRLTWHVNRNKIMKKNGSTSIY